MPKSAGYDLPDFVETYLETLPWEKARPMPEMNRYQDLVRDSFHRFVNIPGFANDVFYYECKFAIDGDGSDPPVEGDTYQNDTSLRLANGKPLSSLNYPFAVIPLVKPGHKLRSFHNLGIDLGDIGMVFWKHRQAAFTYGDMGPEWERIGEGSRFLARQLQIDDDPVEGGIDGEDVPPGIVHICFAGTTDALDSADPRTSRTPSQIQALAQEFLTILLPDR